MALTFINDYMLDKSRFLPQFCNVNRQERLNFNPYKNTHYAHG